MSLTFPLRPITNPTPDEEIARILADPGFGEHFTDHMAVATWRKDHGWGDDAVVPYGPFTLAPAAAVLHYGQEIFEGMKAYRHADGSVWLFRPEMNARRFQTSADRLMLPRLPVPDYLKSVHELIKADERWVPGAEGEMSLYLRPFMFASENFLGVRAAQTVQYCCIASPVGPYFKGGVKPVDIWVTDEYSRAGIGGTGSAKCGGNYASSLIAQYEGYQYGCSQVMFIEAANKERLEELGGMNVFLITSDGKLITPALTGTILEGITRDSVLTVGADLGFEIEERPVSPSDLFDGIRKGEIVEAFSCGTAAVITPIGAFKTRSGEFRLPQEASNRTLQIRDAIIDIQYGRVPDKFGWMQRVI